MDRNDWNGHFFTMADFSFLGSLSLLDTDKKKRPIFPRFRPWRALMQAVMKGVKRSVGMPKPFRNQLKPWIDETMG